jgi:hypothetical protein
MFKKLTYLFLKIITLIILMLLLLFPIVNFKITLESEIFPCIEIILAYYLSTNYPVRSWHVFITGFFIDQIHSMPIATNSLALILAHMWLNYVSKWFVLKTYVTSLANFYGYCLIILILRYFIIIGFNPISSQLLILFFQYMTTISSYPLVKIMLDKLLKDNVHHAR